MPVAEIISIISVVISALTAGIAGVAIKASQTQKNMDMNNQQYEDIKEWYEESLEAMKELYLCYLNEKEPSKDMKNVLRNLSTKIDFGRIFFNNKIDGDYGINKPEIFKGRRPLILDFMILYYDIFDKGLQGENADILRGIQRAFTSEMTLFLKENQKSSKFVPYEVYDENDIVQIKNLNNKAFRYILLQDDIADIVKNPDEKILNQLKSFSVKENQKVQIVENLNKNVIVYDEMNHHHNNIIEEENE